MRHDTMRHPAHSLLAAPFAFFLLTALPAQVAAQTAETSSPQVSEDVLRRAPTVAPASLPEIASNAIQDFRHVPSLSNAAILVIGGVGAALGHSSDRTVSSALSQSNTLGSVFGVGETAGGARTQLAAALGTYAVGRISRNSKVAAIGADLLEAQILAQTMTAAIKLSVGRTRPDGTQYSFPSGHSSVTFATATVLQRDLGWKVGIPAYGLATYVAASRIQDKRHFLSDVTFGAAIGIVAGRSVTVGTGNARFAIAPAPARGGGAISFTWLGQN